MNVAEKLAREITRVTTIRANYAALDGKRGLEIKPALWLIDLDLERAKRAAGMDDAVEQIAALQELEGWQE